MNEYDFYQHLKLYFEQGDIKIDKVKQYLTNGKTNFCFLLGIMLEKRYQDNNESKICSLCQSKFTAMNRRHHCRVCQQLFCGQCSQVISINLNENEQQQQQRVCFMCTRVYQSQQLHGSIHSLFGLKQVKSFITDVKQCNPVVLSNFVRVLSNAAIVDEERKALWEVGSTVLKGLLMFFKELLDKHVDDVELSQLTPFVQLASNLLQSQDSRHYMLLRSVGLGISILEKALKQFYDKKEANAAYTLQLLRLYALLTADQDFVTELMQKPATFELLEKLTYSTKSRERLPVHLIYWYTLLTNITLSSRIKAQQSLPMLIHNNVFPELYQWALASSNIVHNVTGTRFFYALLANQHTRKYVLGSNSLNVIHLLAKKVKCTENVFLNISLFEMCKPFIETSIKNEDVYDVDIFTHFFNTDVQHSQADDYKVKLKYLMYICKKDPNTFNNNMEREKALVNFLKQMYSYNDLNRALKYLSGQTTFKYFQKYGMLNLTQETDIMQLDQYDFAEDCFYNKKKRLQKSSVGVHLGNQQTKIDNGFNIFGQQQRSKK